MKMQLFDAEDLKAFEDTLFRAMVRAMRVISKEAKVAGWQPPVEAAPATEPQSPTLDQPEDEVTTAPGRRTRRSYADVVKSVPSRPIGYITVEDARELMNMPETTAAPTLRNWIFDSEVKAVIACDARLAPTHGLPGRLMVEKESLLQRNRQRIENAALAPRYRDPFPRPASMNGVDDHPSPD